MWALMQGSGPNTQSKRGSADRGRRRLGLVPGHPSNLAFRDVWHIGSRRYGVGPWIGEGHLIAACRKRGVPLGYFLALDTT